MALPFLIKLPEVNSTSTWLKEHAEEVSLPALAITDRQTGGRGQRGNSWEAEPGKNLTFSVIFKPEGITPARQFFISEAVCLGVVDALRRHLPNPDEVRVKWPNDVYAGDKKICGILIEHSLESATTIRHTIAGIGVNVNQERFTSPAPNPVSIINLTGTPTDKELLLEQIVDAMFANLDAAPPELHSRYIDTLWRGRGLHPFATPDGDVFSASIEAIDPAGALSLRHADGSLTTHLFKEVQFIL